MTKARSAAAALISFTLICLSAAFNSSWADEPGKPPVFGKRLFIEYEAPQSAVAQFAAFKPSTREEYESALENATRASSEYWITPELMVSPNANPYTIVVRASGKARVHGPVAAVWRAGWRLASEEVQTSSLPMSRTGDAREGESIELLGSQLLVTGNVGEQRIKVLVRADAPIGPGDDLWLRPEPDKVRWFDARTRDAILVG